MRTGMTGRRQVVRRRALPVLLAVMMVMTMGFMPTGKAHASIPTINYAASPKAYSSGYTKYKGIDISNWQGALTVSQFKALKKKGIDFVIVRVGYTRWASFLRFADASYDTNIENAYRAGMRVGAYYYSQAKTTGEAVKEAEKTIKLLKKYKSKITLPVAFDYEFEGRLSSRRSSSLKKANAAICSAYCDKIKKAGYDPMVYAATGQLTSYLDTRSLEKKYKIWAANFMRSTSHTTSYTGQMFMWQFSDSGRFGTALTNTDRVDVNYMYIKNQGYWKQLKNGKYRYYEGSSYLKNKWLNLNGKIYYLGPKGCRYEDCYKLIGSYYYGFNPNGVMYQATPSQKLLNQEIQGKICRFTPSGRAVQYKAKVVNMPDGSLNYRTGPGTSYTVKGSYPVGKKVNIIRISGDWAQMANGYWSLMQDDDNVYLKIKKTYPLEIQPEPETVTP